MEKPEVLKKIKEKLFEFKGKENKGKRLLELCADVIATEIYQTIIQANRIQKMATGKCIHDFEIFDDDSYYPEMAKQRCRKCGMVKMSKRKK